MCVLLELQASFGPISWVLNSELFSVDARSAAVGLASIVNFGALYRIVYERTDVLFGHLS